LEFERIVAILRAVEFRAALIGLRRVVQPSGVVHAHRLAGGCFRAGAGRHILFLKRGDS
jgi:hypothetical protein